MTRRLQYSDITVVQRYTVDLKISDLLDRTRLQTRLQTRLRLSKNLILFLSSNTINSRALKEEIDYGINNQGLPVIVVYPEYNTKESLLINGSLKKAVKDIWNNLPIFRESMNKVPTLHVPWDKSLIKKSLLDRDFMLSTKLERGTFHYKI